MNVNGLIGRRRVGIRDALPVWRHSRVLVQTGRQLQAVDVALSIDEGKIAHLDRCRAGGGVNQESSIRDVKMRDASIGAWKSPRSQQTFDDGHGSALGLQAAEIKRDGKKDALE